MSIAPNHQLHSTEQTTATGQRTECPACTGTLRGVVTSKPRWNKQFDIMTVVRATYCPHCETITTAEFPAGGSRPISPVRGVYSGATQINQLLAAHPQLREVLDV